jgi:hypothetical protein
MDVLELCILAVSWLYLVLEQGCERMQRQRATQAMHRLLRLKKFTAESHGGAAIPNRAVQRS